MDLDMVLKALKPDCLTLSCHLASLARPYTLSVVFSNILLRLMLRLMLRADQDSAQKADLPALFGLLTNHLAFYTTRIRH
jgi:hypothetical protein